MRYYLCFAFILATCSMTFAYRIRYVEVHDMDNGQSELEQLPPKDPAMNTFPKSPNVPYMPNCVNQGYFRDPFNCGKFYTCDYSGAVPIAYYCQSGLIFDTNSNSCDDPDNVQC